MVCFYSSELNPDAGSESSCLYLGQQNTQTERGEQTCMLCFEVNMGCSSFFVI
jgi:hypothetical protein